ncbi:hypothetical protein CASFOL_036932 [Castilleja foliolosa]|uniref:Uncharacterized protein n=1 Tax=Castilleja foliolosa TaxID=1961234 RepID=A0ABD3BQ33_9LAMI
MALNLGYEYSIDVSIDNNIKAHAISNLVVESKVYIFIKLQTNFKVIRKLDNNDDEEDMYNCAMLEKECLTATFFVPTPHGDFRELFVLELGHHPLKRP